MRKISQLWLKIQKFFKPLALMIPWAYELIFDIFLQIQAPEPFPVALQHILKLLVRMEPSNA
jgi:hypothetical protein